MTAHSLSWDQYYYVPGEGVEGGNASRWKCDGGNEENRGDTDRLTRMRKNIAGFSITRGDRAPKSNVRHY